MRHGRLQLFVRVVSHKHERLNFVEKFHVASDEHILLIIDANGKCLRSCQWVLFHLYNITYSIYAMQHIHRFPIELNPYESVQGSAQPPFFLETFTYNSVD